MNDDEQDLGADRDNGSRMLASGAAIIVDYLTRLPNAPGVYRMIGAAGDVLYVGKAANL